MVIPARQDARSIGRNVAYAAMTWILPVLLSIIATPVIVRTLGIETYGIYALVLGLISYSFSFGIGRAATKYVAEYRATGESGKIRSVISATLLLSVLIGLGGLLTLSALASWLVTDVLLIGAASQADAVKAIYVAGAIILVSTVNQVYGGVLQGLHRFDLYSKIFNASSIALLSGNLLLAYLGFGLHELLLWNLVTLSATMIGFAAAARRTLPETTFDPTGGREALPIVFRYSLGIVGYQILANALLLFERGWVTRKLGADSLAYYAVAMSIGVYIHGFASSLMLTIAPLASETQDDKERLLSLYKRTTKLIAAIVLLLGTIVAFGHNAFLTLWLGPDFAEKAGILLVLHVATFCINAILGVSWLMREGLGVPKHNVYIFAFCFVITIALMLMLAEPYGLVGIAAARFIGFTAIFLSAFQFERWLFGKAQGTFWFRGIFTFAIAVLAAGSLELFIINNMALGWLSFGVAAMAGTTVFGAVLWLMGFISSDEKLMIRRALGK